MFYNNNLSCVLDDSSLSDYFETASAIARRIDENFANRAKGYIVIKQLEELVEQRADLNYNALIEYAQELADEADAATLVEAYGDKAKFYKAFENAGLSSSELSQITIQDDEAVYAGLRFTFNHTGELVLGDA